jgi:penicillin-binding protein 1C
MRDNWCIGFSRRYTVGVWVGNSSGEPIRDVTGVSGAAPAWLEILSALEAEGAPGEPALPPGIVSRAIRFPHGVDPPRREWFIDGTEPSRVKRRLLVLESSLQRVAVCSPRIPTFRLHVSAWPSNRWERRERSGGSMVASSGRWMGRS